jgi:Polyketide cyclase / dehydrase and lipid transport
MNVKTQASRRFSAPPKMVYDLIVDATRFPRTFTGYGPIPAVSTIVLDGPLRVGGTRRISNADGSVLTEHVTGLERPVYHAYTLFGFQPPFSWLVTLGEADWCIHPTDNGTEVIWRYAFTLTSPLVYPICTLVIGFFMRRAMERCLANMADLLVTEVTRIW